MILTRLTAVFVLVVTVRCYSLDEVQVYPTRPPPPPMKSASLNKWVDVITVNVASNAEKLGIEPLTLPNVSSPLTSKWYFPYDHLTLADGVLKNLQTVKRQGNCTVTYVNKTIEIKVDAAFTNLEVEYIFQATSTYSWFSLGGLLQGNVGEMEVFGDLTLDADTLEVKAKKITFPGTKKIDFCIKSTILATWVVNAILEVVDLFSGFILDHVETTVTNAINEFFEKHVPHMITQQAWISSTNSFYITMQ